jgi:hypothetical protein
MTIKNSYIVPKETIIKALADPCTDRLKDFYSVGPIQRANIETFADLVVEFSKPYVDRSAAVNLARNILDGADITNKGLLALCNAVLDMDKALQ